MCGSNNRNRYETLLRSNKNDNDETYLKLNLRIKFKFTYLIWGRDVKRSSIAIQQGYRLSFHYDQILWTNTKNWPLNAFENWSTLFMADFSKQHFYVEICGNRSNTQHKETNTHTFISFQSQRFIGFRFFDGCTFSVCIHTVGNTPNPNTLLVVEITNSRILLCTHWHWRNESFAEKDRANEMKKQIWRVSVYLIVTVLLKVNSLKF